MYIHTFTHMYIYIADMFFSAAAPRATRPGSTDATDTASLAEKLARTRRTDTNSISTSIHITIFLRPFCQCVFQVCRGVCVAQRRADLDTHSISTSIWITIFETLLPVCIPSLSRCVCGVAQDRHKFHFNLDLGSRFESPSFLGLF